MSEDEVSWSIMKYDLKTGLDVLKLPCSVKLADDRFDNAPDERSFRGDMGCEIQFQKKCSVCFVRARIMDLPDIDWFIRKKGEEFVRNHAQFAGTTILIPLEYGGRVRLYDRKGGKEYFTVKELVEEFPRYIKATDDMICASPGDRKPQIVNKGTVLELDRITKSLGTFRGHREAYLICKDNENNKELAFRYMSAVSFMQIPDNTKCVLKDFVERLSLPQTVEFININPYDVISVDDDDAKDLLEMLSGPVQLLGLQMENFIVGKVKSDDNSDCDNSIIAIPEIDHVLESFNVRLPCDNRNSYKVRHKSNCSYVDVTVADDTLFECINQKLYLRCERDETPLVVRTYDPAIYSYDTTDPPDTPPIPEKCETLTLTPAFSMPVVNAKANQERPKLTRKRFLSANDIGRRKLSACSEGELQPRRGLRTYFSQFSFKMKSTASQILFGLEAFSGKVDQDIPEIRQKALTGTPSMNGFICYLDTDINHSVSENSDLTDGTNREQCVSETVPGIGSNQDRAIHNTDDVIYATVHKLKNSKQQNSSAGQCHICKNCRLISL